jgi:hypothetical protein
MSLELSGLTELVVILLPLLALLTVMILAIQQIARRRRGGPVRSTGRYGAKIGQQRIEKVPPPDSAAPPPPAPVSEAASGAGRQVGVREVEARIAKAEAAGAQSELPFLYLALARHRLALSEQGEAGDLLRKCIRLAAQLGEKKTHAAARLELGDLVREQGDLTTACEHWQIARGLLYELKVADELAQAERRMRQNGCPTDWVLNDF